MKKFNVFIAAVLLTLLSGIANAQSKAGADYFKGKWSVLLKGTPDGDAKMIFALENQMDSITGVVQDSTGKEIAKITKTELKDNEVTLYFNVQNYDVNLLLKKKDDDHVTGNLMGMFEAEGDRVKASKLTN